MTDSFVASQFLESVTLKNVEIEARRLALAMEMASEIVLEDLQTLCWFQLSHRSGFVREKALRQLAGPAPHPFLLALALRRLNDWVPEVRAAARQVLPTVLLASDPDWLAQTLWLILSHWASWGRLGEAERKVVLGLAAHPEVLLLLLSDLQQCSAGPAAKVLTQLGRCDILDVYLPLLARTARQPAVRVKAYRSLFSGKMQWFAGRQWQWTDVRYCQGRQVNVIAERFLSSGVAFEETLTQASRDPAVAVRRLAAEVLITQFARCERRVTETLIARLALDPSPSVAERGAFAQRKYLDALESGIHGL